MICHGHAARFWPVSPSNSPRHTLGFGFAVLVIFKSFGGRPHSVSVSRRCLSLYHVLEYPHLSAKTLIMADLRIRFVRGLISCLPLAAISISPQRTPRTSNTVLLIRRNGAGTFSISDEVKNLYRKISVDSSESSCSPNERQHTSSTFASAIHQRAAFATVQPRSNDICGSAFLTW